MGKKEVDVHSFYEELDRSDDSPVNAVSRQVKEYLSTAPYIEYAQAVYPLDNVVSIYALRYQSLVKALRYLKDEELYDENGLLQISTLSRDSLAEVQSYLSSLFSCLDVLKEHATKQSVRKDLLEECARFINMEITDFFRVLCTHIVYLINVPTVIQFSSGRGENKLVYSVSELLKFSSWQKSTKFMASLGEYLTLENLILDFHSQVRIFLDQYEKILFTNNAQIFNQVLETLHGFATQYRDIGKRGFLPVSEEYLTDKLKFK